MRLTWKDTAATAIVAAAGGLYAWHLADPDVTFVGSTRWMGAVLFVLGVAACATGAQSLRAESGYAKVMSRGAGLAVILALVTCITGYEVVLAALALLIGVMWLVTTVRHTLGLQIETGGPAAPMQTRELQHH